jgi:hypothetical protein
MPNETLPISICTAFLRSEVMSLMLSSSKQFEGSRILVRWRPGDLLAGASDLAAYNLAKSMGFQFWIKQDFHGKVFSLPGHGVLVGSANMTMSGLGLSANYNSEVCTLVPPADTNLELIDNLFLNALLMNDELFQEFSNALALMPKANNHVTQWPDALMDKLAPIDLEEKFLISELGNIKVSSDHDRCLLGLMHDSIDVTSMITIFTSSKSYRWLTATLQANGNEMYFGALAQKLHDSLLEDPRVYRSEVKQMLVVLLDWCATLPNLKVVVDRPNHSQRVRYLALSN